MKFVSNLVANLEHFNPHSIRCLATNSLHIIHLRYTAR